MLNNLKLEAGQKIWVLYDGACPRCVKDRDNYVRLAGHHGENVSWFDITGKDELLKRWGIAPYKALTELHVVIGDIEALELHIQAEPSASNSGHSSSNTSNSNNSSNSSNSNNFAKGNPHHSADGIDADGIETAGRDIDNLALTPRVLSELDAYIVLMHAVPLLKPLAWFMNLSWLRPRLADWYHKAVLKRLKRQGRL